MYTQPTVTDRFLQWDELPDPLPIPSSQWKEWLENNRKFKLIIGNSSFSAFKDKRGYWVAQRRVGGKLNQKRLGNTETLARLDFEELAATAILLSAKQVEVSFSDFASEIKKETSDYSLSELSNLQNELSTMQENQQALERKIMQLEREIKSTNHQYLEEAVYTLTKALEFKSNAGGAIKDSIRKALDLIHLSRLERSLVQIDRPDREVQAGLPAENG